MLNVNVACGTDDCVSAQVVGDPNQLFVWALKGVGKRDDDAHNELLVVLKEASYDQVSGKSLLVIDVQVPGVMNLSDQMVESKITEIVGYNGAYKVYVDILYSNALLKKADGMFFVKPISENKTELSVKFKIRFGWFFNIFITQRRYRNLFEWRCDGFMLNMKNEMERRSNLEHK